MRNLFLFLGIFAQIGILTDRTFGGGETSSAGGVPTFTLDQAILTALQRNPALLNAEQEIKRTKGVIIEIRAQALPHITPAGTFEWTDPNLIGARILGGTTGTSTTPGTATTSGAASIVDSPPSQVRDSAGAALAGPSPPPGAPNTQLSDISYTISV